MNLIFIAVAVVIVSASLINTKTTLPIESESAPIVTETATSTAMPSIEPTPSPTSTPIPESTESPSPSPTNTPSGNTNNSGWFYPGAIMISEGEKTVLESSDDTDTITDWYKGKIEGEGFNVRSSVKTSANDNIKNVISAAKNNSNVHVEITKKPDANVVRIELKVSI